MSDNIFEEFEELDEENNQPDFAEQLIEAALEGKHNEIGFVRNVAGYNTLKVLKRANLKLVKHFNMYAKKLFKKFLEQITDAYSDIETFRLYRTCLICKEYYQKEAEMADDMLDEYLTYVKSGHIIDTMLGKIRPEEDLRDFRKAG